MKQTQTDKIEWKEVNLGNLDYFKITSSGINKFNGEKDYLSTESIKGTKIEKIECKITYQDRPSRANMQPILNSVWFAKMKSTLKVYSFSNRNKDDIDRYILSTGFAGLHFHKNISSDYIKFFLLTKKFNEEKDKLSTGSTQSGINNSFISKIKISLPFSNGQPDLKEQERIVSILEKAEKLKTQSKTAEKLLDEYLKSVFNEMFGDPVKNEKNWEVKKLVEILKENKNIVGGPFGSNLKVVDYKDSGIPIMRLQNIGQARFVDKNIKYISEEKAESLRYHSFKSGDIILAKLGETLGKSCIVPEKYRYGIVIGDVIRIRIPKESCNKQFILYFLNTKYCGSLLFNQVMGTTRPRVNLNNIRNIPVFFPSLTLQQKFAKIVEQVEKMKEETKKTQKNSEEMFDSLMQKTFRGEL